MFPLPPLPALAVLTSDTVPGLAVLCVAALAGALTLILQNRNCR